MQRLHLYTIIIILTIALSSTALAANAATVPLSWRDTGYDLANGYRHTITLTAHYTRIIPIYIDAGQAWIQAGPLKASLTVVTGLTGFHYEFKIEINDETVYTDTASVHLGSDEVSFAFQVEIDCNGNAIVYVGGQQVGAFQINTVTDILKNSEGDASVTITATRMQSCSNDGGSGSVNPPPNPPPEGTGLAAVADALSAAGRVALTIVIAIVLIVVVLTVLAKQGGVKKLARKAIG